MFNHALMSYAMFVCLFIRIAFLVYYMPLG
jgi:hypothetical protein